LPRIGCAHNPRQAAALTDPSAHHSAKIRDPHRVFALGARMFPMPAPLNKYSAHVTQPKSQGASQAMLYGTGLTEEDMNKAQVGIVANWFEGNTCNMHLNNLAAKVKEGVAAANLVPMRFNTIGVSDGLSMGT
jgi:dihydroxyacid dehydratase/phosphogluconate dehydratase